MENLQEVKTLFDLINIFNKIIPDGAEENLEVNGTIITITKNEGDVNISISSDTKFDDSNIKEVIKEYKELIEEVDDCLFLEAVEEIGKHIDINQFNNLLDKDSFTEQEADEVNAMINYSLQIIRNHLADKIQDLVKLYNKF